MKSERKEYKAKQSEALTKTSVFTFLNFCENKSFWFLLLSSLSPYNSLDRYVLISLHLLNISWCVLVWVELYLRFTLKASKCIFSSKHVEGYAIRSTYEHLMCESLVFPGEILKIILLLYQVSDHHKTECIMNVCFLGIFCHARTVRRPEFENWAIKMAIYAHAQSLIAQWCLLKFDRFGCRSSNVYIVRPT